jgi:hypothetical protein
MRVDRVDDRLLNAHGQRASNLREPRRLQNDSQNRPIRLAAQA